MSGQTGAAWATVRRARRWTIGGGVALVVALTAGVCLGPVSVPPVTVWRIVAHHCVGWPGTATWSEIDNAIVWEIRTPRVLLGAVSGAGLSVAGVVIQAITRNVLADPFLLGVTSGASVGAATVLLFAGAAATTMMLSGAAFAGAAAAIAAVFLVARTGGPLTATRLVLAGVAVAYALSSVTSFLIFASDSRDGARAVLFWLLGGLYRGGWRTVAEPAVVVLVSTALLWLWARRLDLLAIGDDTAISLGVDPTRARVQLTALVALCVGAVVAVSGAIGFVGLVVPHVARRLVGGDHRQLLPVAALGGATFLVVGDLIARTAFAPREMPVGIVTAVIGAPFLIGLVRRFRTIS